MKDWDDYRIILALHRAGTLRGAAQLMGVNHATISRKLAIINKRYDYLVFERVAGGYRATSLGQEIISSAERIEDVTIDSERSVRAKASKISGPITLSIPPTIGQFLLLNTLDKFSRDYPKIALTITVSNRRVNLDRSEADVVIRGDNQPPEHLVGRCLFSYALSYYANRDYLKNTQTKDLRWIAKPEDKQNSEWIAQSPYPNAPIGVRIDDIVTRHMAATAGQGLTRGACYMADQEPALMRIPGAKVTPAQQLWILTHPDLRDTPRIKVLMQFLATEMMSKKALVEGKNYIV
jgi:DNA-binding transcriptional LysR family regulator